MTQNTQHSNLGHILVVTSPLQGHIAPLVKLTHQIARFVRKITFVNTSPTRSNMSGLGNLDCRVKLVSILDDDHLEHKDDWTSQEKLFERVHVVLPDFLENLLSQSLMTEDDRISGVIIDSPFSCMIEIPKKMGCKVALYWCSSPGCLALALKIPELIQSKFIDSDGTPLTNKAIQVQENIPPMPMTSVMWHFPGDKNIQKLIFHQIKSIASHMRDSDWILCNWFSELDPLAHVITPNVLPIGPLLAKGLSSGSLCSEDSTCLDWLDKQPESSVVYVAFGSTSRFSQEQLKELALGLELMGRPYLYVGWSGLSNDGSTNSCRVELEKHVTCHGKIVEWAPQEMVLGHPSTACFVTHCGWGSCMESLSMGVPMLCWPYFGDQMYTQICICDDWKVGISLDKGEGGIVSRYEIKQKVEELLNDGMIRENALRLKGMARNSTSNGGSSLLNLEYMIQQMKCKTK